MKINAPLAESANYYLNPGDLNVDSNSSVSKSPIVIYDKVTFIRRLKSLIGV